MDTLYYNCTDEQISGEKWKQHPIYENYEDLGNVDNCLKGIRKSHKNYRFKYHKNE